MKNLRFASLLATAGLAALLAAAAPAFAAQASDSSVIDEVVVTATANPEHRSHVAGTIQVISPETIARSPAKNMTELLAESSVAFLSEWGPSQTSINIRGGASDGQGRDYLGDVLVLVNGRRAGTANFAKLSPNDVLRVEVVRGPASVLYGSQNIGGVVNVIMKDGKSALGYGANLQGGSAGFLQGGLNIAPKFGPFDLYIGLNGGRKGDYHSGKGGTKMVNTDFTRHGATVALGWDIDANNRILIEGRSDGVYDAGFRGSGSNTIAHDDRDNRSFDAIYDGKYGDRISLTAKGYVVADVDELWQASPVVKNGTLPGPGTSADHNLRHQWINGFQIRPTVKLWDGNSLTVGFDGERSVLRSKRFRQAVAGAPALAQIVAQDNNQTDRSKAFYAEDSQSLYDDKVTLRGGYRRTQGRMSFDPTPFLALQLTKEVNYDADTWSFGGTYRPIDGWALRAGSSNGFRVPSATQLGADFTALGGGRTFGNPNLKPETSKQYEVGAIYSRPNFGADLALFQNTITNRITTLARVPAALNTSDYINNPKDLFIRGLEVQTDTNLMGLIDLQSDWSWSLRANGYYNFDMADKGAPATANTNNIQRMYRYEGSFDTRFGKNAGAHPWAFDVVGVLRGPVWYDTEENLLIPQGELVSTEVHRKNAFWVFNLRGEVALSPQFTLSTTVTNLLDRNYHALFIAEDKDPRLADPRFQNGGLGTSAPGREFMVKLAAKF